jgi:general stress protein 26
MSDQDNSTEETPVFDPVKLQEVNVSKDYPMNPDEFDKLFNYNCYCDMAHVNKNGFPIVTPMFYVIVDGMIHMSSIQKHRHKVHHLENDSRISVSIHNDGAELKHQKAILVIGRGEVSYDNDLMTKVHWAIIDKYWRELVDEELRQVAFTAIHTDLRAIIKVNPTKVISWDFGKMVEAHQPGVWFGDAYDMVKDL